MNTTEKITYNKIVFHFLMLLGFVIIFALFSCDSTKGEMIDNNEYAVPQDKIVVTGTLKVGETITATYDVPGAAQTLFKFDFKEHSNIYDRSGTTVTYVYKSPGRKVIYAVAKNENRYLLDDCKKIVEIFE